MRHVDELDLQAVPRLDVTGAKDSSRSGFLLETENLDRCQ